MNAYITRWSESKGIQQRLVIPLEGGKASDAEKPHIVYEAHEWFEHETDAIERTLELVDLEKKARVKQLHRLKTKRLELLTRNRELKADRNEGSTKNGGLENKTLPTHHTPNPTGMNQ